MSKKTTVIITLVWLIIDQQDLFEEEFEMFLWVPFTQKIFDVDNKPWFKRQDRVQ